MDSPSHHFKPWKLPQTRSTTHTLIRLLKKQIVLVLLLQFYVQSIVLIVVIPIAIMMLVKGYRKHRKKWVVGVGSLGILFIIVGAILPYTEAGTSGSANLSAVPEAPTPATGGG